MGSVLIVGCVWLQVDSLLVDLEARFDGMSQDVLGRRKHDNRPYNTYKSLILVFLCSFVSVNPS